MGPRKQSNRPNAPQQRRNHARWRRRSFTTPLGRCLSCARKSFRSTSGGDSSKGYLSLATFSVSFGTDLLFALSPEAHLTTGNYPSGTPLLRRRPPLTTSSPPLQPLLAAMTPIPIWWTSKSACWVIAILEKLLLWSACF